MPSNFPASWSGCTSHLNLDTSSCNKNVGQFVLLWAIEGALCKVEEVLLHV